MGIGTQLCRAFVVLVTLTLSVLPVAMPASPVAAAGVWYVATTGYATNDCQSPATPCPSIVAVFAEATFQPGDTIKVAAGIYSWDADPMVTILKSVTLSGGWNPSFTEQTGVSVHDGGRAHRVFFIQTGAKVDIQRFGIQQGYTPGYGAGLLSAGQVTFRNSSFTANRADNSGGAIEVEWGSLTLDGVTFTRNWTGGCGGAIHSGFTTVIANSTFNENSAVQGGGALCAGTGSLIVRSSAVHHNSAAQGGGIWCCSVNSPSAMTLENSTVSSNTAETGGGIYGDWNSLTIIGSTISNNSSTSGGGIANPAANITLRDTLLAGNTANTGPDCTGSVVSQGYSLVGSDAGCAYTSMSGDLSGVDPRLDPLVGPSGGTWFHPLRPDSPAINAGNPAGCSSATDQRGVARVGRCDIGAYEYTAPGPATQLAAIPGTPQRALPSQAFSTPFQVAVLDAMGSPVPGVVVTFEGPSSGAGGRFADTGNNKTVAITDEGGLATASVFTANLKPGIYSVTATAAGLASRADFSLANIRWHVAPGGNDGNNCMSVAQACRTVGSVMRNLWFIPGDSVRVAAGNYSNLAAPELLLDRNVALLGGWSADFVTQNGISVFDGIRANVAQDVTVTMERFTLQHGTADQSGGCLTNGGVLSLADSSIVGCHAAFEGGGIANGGHLTLTHVTLQGNSAYGGGGIVNYHELVLDESTIKENTAVRDGGGILNTGGVLTGTLSGLSTNRAGGFGGGLRCLGGNVTVNRSTLSSNQAQEGAGMLASGCAVALNNSTVTRNTSDYGAGLEFSSSPATLSSCTVAGNVARVSTGGIRSDWADTVMQNTILVGNIPTGCTGQIVSAGYNLVDTPSHNCDFTQATGDLVNSDPLLRNLEGSPGWYSLLRGSPAINAGNPAGCADDKDNLLLVDQRGSPRIGRCDIGSYEGGLYASKAVAGTFLPGGTVTYTIALENLGGGIDLAPVFVSDTIPLHLQYVSRSYSASGGVGSINGNALTWQGTVNREAPTTISFAVQVDPSVPRARYVNTVHSQWGVTWSDGEGVFDTWIHSYLPVMLIRNF